jgi:hypothetical protein
MSAVFFAALSLAIDCPPTNSLNPSEYDLDPNQIAYKLICVVEAIEGDVIDRELTACDPDEDNGGFVFTLDKAPVGTTVGQVGGSWRLTWPGAVGMYYVDVNVRDIPIGGDVEEDNGTIAFRIYHRNNPPVIGGCR